MLRPVVMSMSPSLRSLSVLVLDCQAGGATPAYGDVLELGWAICGDSGLVGPVHQCWVQPRTTRRVPRAIRELTGWSEACTADAVPEAEAWAALRETAAHGGGVPMPTLIHYARFELPFLRDLHERLGGGEFPFETRCLHAIGARLFPDLPRRNIRALAGFLGHTPELIRRSGGHVEASAFIWRALLPYLEEQGVTTWEELTAFIDEAPKAVRRGKRVYPLPIETRRALPDRPGVYRFLRRNRSVLYVGKATSLKKRIAGHFSARGPSTERGLELLSQVHDLAITETASILEAALLETDEIKRIDPPYNVQLRSGERKAWFASRDLRTAREGPDGEHRIGPLPSERALSSLYGLRALVAGVDVTPGLCALALAVPTQFLPEPALFLEGYAAFANEHLQRSEPTVARRLAAASRALWIARGRNEIESSLDDTSPELWDLARVRRRLERALVQTGLLMRRARLLRLLAEADVVYRERDMTAARALLFARGEIVERRDLASVAEIATLPKRPRARDTCFDAAAYDRLRVLLTELMRVQHEDGELALRFGAHAFTGERLANLLRAV